MLPKGKISCRVRCLNKRIRFRIVHVFVKTIDDPCQAVFGIAQVAIEAFAKVGVHNFPGVGLAYCRNVVGVDHAGFHVVYAAIAFEVAVVEEFLRQADDVLHDGWRINPLVFQVMNGVNNLHILVERIVGKVFFQEDAHEACVPVITMNDVRLEADLRQHGQDSPAEVGKAFVVVFKAIETVALEVPFIVNEIDRYAVDFDGFHTKIQLAPGQVDHTVDDRFHLGLPFFADLAVFRQDEPDVHPLCGQRFGQGAHDVSQTTGLNERNGFRRRE